MSTDLIDELWPAPSRSERRPMPGPGVAEPSARRPQPGPGRPAEPAGQSLRGLAVRGGLYLVLREGIGILVRLLGVSLLTLVLGPSEFGVYITATAVVAVLASVAQLGSEVYLVRFPQEPDEIVYHRVASALLVWSLAMAGVGLVVAQALTFVLPDHRFLLPLDVLVLTMPINVLWAPAQARIERAFRYRAMGMLELSGDVTLYAVGITLVLAGAGVWGPIFGYIAWQGVLLVGSWTLARLRPTWAWDRGEWRRVLHFGRSYTAATLVTQASTLVNPLVVGHFLGTRLVGEIALGARAVDTFNFVGRAIWRLSLVVFGRLARDFTRLGEAVTRVMSIQILLVAPIYVGFALIAPSLVGSVFGPQWAVTLVVFPYLATQSLLNSLSVSLVSAAYTIDRPRVAVQASMVSLVVQVGLGIVLVPLWGAVGFGVCAVATNIGVIVLYTQLRDALHVRFWATAPWLIAAVALVFAREVTWWWLTLVPVLVLPLLPGIRAQVQEARSTVRTELRNRRQPQLAETGLA